jgi:hypothetical protein
LTNLYIGYAKGFALLSNSPTESKIANFQEGFGFFRKINWSIGTFVSTSLIYISLLKRRKRDVILLGIVVFFFSLDGSKASMLQIAVSAGIILYHPAFRAKRQIIKSFQRYIPLIFASVMVLFFVVLFKENDSPDEAFFAFIRRLLYSADSVLFYYQPVNIDYFSKFSIFDYISRITNPILGFFRLVPYQEAPGNIMVDNLRPAGSTYTITVGPNAPFYIEGKIYFKYWAAFPYSMLIGYLYASIRIYYFSLVRASAFYYIYVASFVHLSFAIIIDTNLAVTQLFDLFFFVIPLYVIISLVITGKVKMLTKSILLK